MKLSCSLIFLFSAELLFAQFPPPQTNEPVKPDTASGYEKERKPDSLREKFYPRSIRIGTDIISLIKSQTKSSFSGWELNGDIDLGKFYLAFDYGSWGRNLGLANGGDYYNNGTYWRAGIDANLLKKDPDRNMLFLGFRYGRSSFSESATIFVKDKAYGDFQKELHNPSVTAGWGELVGGIKVKVWKELWMGYTARLKFAAGGTGATELETYDIPGFGVKQNTFYWGFNYQVFWRIPFKREKRAPEKKKTAGEAKEPSAPSKK